MNCNVTGCRATNLSDCDCYQIGMGIRAELRKHRLTYLIALAIVALAFAVALMIPRQAEAWGHAAAAPVAAPILKALGIKGAAASGGVGAGVVGGGIGAVGGAIAWCGMNQPKRNYRRDVWVDHHSDIVESGTQYRPRKDGCLTKKKRQHRAADPAKLWPNGK